MVRLHFSHGRSIDLAIPISRIASRRLPSCGARDDHGLYDSRGSHFLDEEHGLDAEHRHGPNCGHGRGHDSRHAKRRWERSPGRTLRDAIRGGNRPPWMDLMSGRIGSRGIGSHR